MSLFYVFILFPYFIPFNLFVEQWKIYENLACLDQWFAFILLNFISKEVRNDIAIKWINNILRALNFIH